MGSRKRVGAIRISTPMKRGSIDSNFDLRRKFETEGAEEGNKSVT